MQGPHEGTADEGSLISTPPSLDLHPYFNHFHLFADSYHIQSFTGLIDPYPQGTLISEA